jgi:surfeit locus 1 family protein
MAASVFQTGPPAPLLQRDWPKANTGVEKHYGYAFQWFGLAALIAILYVWFQIVRRFIPKHSRRSEPV